MTSSLLHIGYPKAASSFLQTWFASHPEVLYRHRGLLGLGSTADLRDLVAGGERDHRCFVTSDEDLAFWRGPTDPRAADVVHYDVAEVQAATCALLHDLMPTATVLVVTRGFEGLVRSAYSQYLRIGGTMRLPELIDAQMPMMRQFWDYDRLIGLYRSTFGPEQVVVEPFEAIRDDAGAVLDRLAARLAISPHPAPAEAVKAGIDDAELEGYRRLSTAVSWAGRAAGPHRGSRLFAAYATRLARGGYGRPRRALGRGAEGRVRRLEPAERAVLAAGATFVEDLPAFAPHRHEYFRPGA